MEKLNNFMLPIYCNSMYFEASKEKEENMEVGLKMKLRVKSFRVRVFLMFFIAIVLPILAFAILVCVLGLSNEALFNNVKNMLKLGSLLVFILSFFLFIVSYRYMNNIWLKVAEEIRKGITAVQTGDFGYKMKFPEAEEFRNLENDYNVMLDKLKENKRELELQALEIYAKNVEINQAATDLESSYGELQATINQLNDSELKYYSLVKNITDIVCVIKLDGSIYYVNEIIKDILGFSRIEIEGKNIKELIKPDMSERFLERVSKGLKNRNSLILDLELISKSGDFVLSEATLTNFIYDGQVIGIQAILRDVTQRKRMEQEIVDSYRELATINSLSRKLNATLELDHVLNLVVKEICRVLNNPLCTLRMIDGQNGKMAAKAFAGEYLNGIINDRSDFSKYSASDELFEKAFDSTNPIIIKDVNSYELIRKINDFKVQGEKIKELLMAPIRTKDRKLGVLTVGTIGKFNSRQKNLLSSIANNAAIAIENAALYDLSKKNFIKTVNALIAAIEAKDKYTQGHSYRVSKYAVILAEKLGLSREQIDEVRIAGILHDIGKIGIPDAILSKPSSLTDEEFEQIKKHPTISNKILEPVGLPDGAVKAITYHHERWDGKGYPFGITNDKLSVEAQIISVADALDAMTSNRAYRKAMTTEEAMKEILIGKDSQFSPAVVDALYELFNTLGGEMFRDDLE